MNFTLHYCFIIVLFLSLSASTFLRHSVAVVSAVACRFTIVFRLMVRNLSRAAKYFKLRQHECKIVEEDTGTTTF